MAYSYADSLGECYVNAGSVHMNSTYFLILTCITSLAVSLSADSGSELENVEEQGEEYCLLMNWMLGCLY